MHSPEGDTVPLSSLYLKVLSLLSLKFTNKTKTTLSNGIDKWFFVTHKLIIMEVLPFFFVA